jgi:hypothetical protein
MNPLFRTVRVLSAVALVTAVPLTAGATLRKEGNWPASEKKVSLEFDGKPSEGLQKLAHEAGWSLVVSKGAGERGERDVHIDVDDQPADAVLEALFVDQDVVARRNGTLITVTPSDGAAGATPTPAPPPSAEPPPVASAAPAIPSPPPVPTVRGEDRKVMGGSLTIHKNEVVHTVTVTGGSVKIEGTVTGDLVVAGGSAKLEEGARVVGNASVFGGSIKMEKGSRIDGDVGVVGGSIKREEGAIIGGTVVDDDHGKVKVSVHDGDVSTSVKSEPSASGRSRLSRAISEFGESMTRMALLFVLGCVLLALLTRRMESLRVETAARPMRAFAIGVVSSFAAAIAVTAISLTIVGIPFVIVGLLFGVLAVYGAIAAVLTTFGAAVIGHRTQNPYLHLLTGCAAFLVVGAIPYAGGLVTLAVTMIAIGVLVTTRLGGATPTARRDLV